MSSHEKLAQTAPHVSTELYLEPRKSQFWLLEGKRYLQCSSDEVVLPHNLGMVRASLDEPIVRGGGTGTEFHAAALQYKAPDGKTFCTIGIMPGVGIMYNPIGAPEGKEKFADHVDRELFMNAYIHQQYRKTHVPEILSQGIRRKDGVFLNKPEQGTQIYPIEAVDGLSLLKFVKALARQQLTDEQRDLALRTVFLHTYLQMDLFEILSLNPQDFAPQNILVQPNLIVCPIDLGEVERGNDTRSPHALYMYFMEKTRQRVAQEPAGTNPLLEEVLANPDFTISPPSISKLLKKFHETISNTPFFFDEAEQEFSDFCEWKSLQERLSHAYPNSEFPEEDKVKAIKRYINTLVKNHTLWVGTPLLSVVQNGEKI